MSAQRWRPMKTAPTDGTMVLVLETPNGEHFNVMPAMYMNLGGGTPAAGENPIGIIRWWGVLGSRRTGEGGECRLPVRWRNLAISPIAWMPLPTISEQEARRKRRAENKRTAQEDTTHGE